MNTTKMITIIKIDEIKTIKNEHDYKHNKKHNMIINKKIYEYWWTNTYNKNIFHQWKYWFSFFLITCWYETDA